MRNLLEQATRVLESVCDRQSKGLYIIDRGLKLWPGYARVDDDLYTQSDAKQSLIKLRRRTHYTVLYLYLVTLRKQYLTKYDERGKSNCID